MSDLIDQITANDMRFNPPKFEEDVIAAKVLTDYGIEGLYKKLDGERDQNFYLKTVAGEEYVVKITGPDEETDVTDFQVQAMLYLEKAAPSLPVPRLFKTKDGLNISSITDDQGVMHALRLVTYLPGIPYGDGKFPGADDLFAIGVFQGTMCKALEGFSHRASKHFMPWNLSNGIAVQEGLWRDAEDDAREVGLQLVERLKGEVLPALNALPSHVIHNDAHPYNLLRADEDSYGITGIIDFGDMVYAPVVNDLAVMATTFQRRNILDIGITINLLKGFHSICPLSDAEVTLLWDAIMLRLIITILLTDIKLKLVSEVDENKDELITDRTEAINMLRYLNGMDRIAAVNSFRAACGYSD